MNGKYDVWFTLNKQLCKMTSSYRIRKMIFADYRSNFTKAKSKTNVSEKLYIGIQNIPFFYRWLNTSNYIMATMDQFKHEKTKHTKKFTFAIKSTSAQHIPHFTFNPKMEPMSVFLFDSDFQNMSSFPNNLFFFLFPSSRRSNIFFKRKKILSNHSPFQFAWLNLTEIFFFFSSAFRIC